MRILNLYCYQQKMLTAVSFKQFSVPVLLYNLFIQNKLK